MKIADLRPAAEYSVAFDLYALNRIADCCGCYCLCTASGDILYVGQALSVRSRLVQHFDSEKRDALTAFGRVSRVYWRAAEASSLSALERGWQEWVRLADGELPPLNRVSAPV
jgi:predicted GIY-YIG superfamily endonuclease